MNHPITGTQKQSPGITRPSAVVLAHRSPDFSFRADHAVMAGAVLIGQCDVAAASDRLSYGVWR